MRGLIIKDDSRYHHTEQYLRDAGYSFCGENAADEGLDFVILPFKGVVDKDVYDDECFASLKEDAVVFSGLRSDYVEEKCREYGLVYHAMMDIESVKVKNAVPTSEGVITYMITNRDDTVAGASVLIIGYGICGRDLSKRLKNLGAHVTALVRNEEKEALALEDGVSAIYKDRLFDGNFPYDIVVNTVPLEVLSNDELDRTEGAMILDIASKPHGLDMEYAKRLNEKSSLLPGIPGKYAARRAGIVLGEYIDQVMKGRNDMTLPLEGKKIGFAICASFCTVLEILEPMRELRRLGAELYPIVSESVNAFDSRFHERDKFLSDIKEITGRDAVSTVAEAETFGPDIQLDIMIIAPVTGNTIAKLANGISDGTVPMATKATLRNGKPALLALYSNDALGANGVNIMKLYNTKNIFFVPFGQDNPAKKPTSMTADLSKLNEALMSALEGKQVQPAIITHE